MITSKTRTVELFRLMFANRDVEPEHWPTLATSASIEWDNRLEMAEHEWGAGASRAEARRYEAYCNGREDELKVRGEDLRIVKILFDALTQAGIAPPRELSASDMLRLRAKE